MTMTTTADRIIARGPCWDEDRVRSTLSPQEEWCALDFFRLYDEHVLTAEDLLWVILHEDLIEEKTLHLIACKLAESALNAEREAGREPHPNSWNAIAVKQRWIKGEASDGEMRKAETEAFFAAKNTSFGEPGREWTTAKSAARAAAESAWAASWCDTGRSRHAAQKATEESIMAMTRRSASEWEEWRDMAEESRKKAWDAHVAIVRKTISSDPA